MSDISRNTTQSSVDADATFSSIVSSLLSIKQNKPDVIGETVSSYASDYHSSIIKEAESLRALPHPLVFISATPPPPNYRSNHKAIHDENSSRRRGSKSHVSVKEEAVSLEADNKVQQQPALGVQEYLDGSKRQSTNDKELQQNPSACMSGLVDSTQEASMLALTRRVPPTIPTSSRDRDIKPPSTDAPMVRDQPYTMLNTTSVIGCRENGRPKQRGYWSDIYGCESSDGQTTGLGVSSTESGEYRGTKRPASASDTVSKPSKAARGKKRTGFRNMGSLPVAVKSDAIREEIAAALTKDSTLNGLGTSSTPKTLKHQESNSNESGEDAVGGYWQWIPVSPSAPHNLPGGTYVPGSAKSIEWSNHTSGPPSMTRSEQNIGCVPNTSRGTCRAQQDSPWSVSNEVEGYFLNSALWQRIEDATSLPKSQSRVRESHGK
mmetsp:Transcript_4796/g.7297  ORF Transcript_4796/g.7297 Transcript_4796/m.7297 type:complete len:435 (-) Transcript_4796:563-1867(-)